MNKFLIFIITTLPLFTLGQSKNNDPIVQQTELRNLRFGLYAQGSLGWLNPEQQKKYSLKISDEDHEDIL